MLRYRNRIRRPRRVALQRKAATTFIFDPEECALCTMNGPSAPRLFITGRGDGLGNTVEAMLYGMAIAAKCGLSFGGVLNGDHISHKFDVGRVANQFFGLSNRSRVFVSDIPVFNATFQHLAELEGNTSDPAAIARLAGDVLLEASMPQTQIDAHRPIEDFFTPQFLSAFRLQIQLSVDQLYSPGQLGAGSTGPLVALHIRRGDVQQGPRGPHFMKGRYTPNEWYYQIIDSIRKHVPEADIHAWSSLRNAKDVISKKRQANEYYTWFDGFRERNVTVHLDEYDELAAWAAMASARIFVMARSSFSIPPALANSHCVIFQHYQTRPLQSWIDGSWVNGTNETSSEMDHEIEECVKRTA